MIDHLTIFKRYITVIETKEGNRIAKTNGGEYKGACPKCGGNDRLCLWPNRHQTEPTKPVFWCRICNWSGSLTAFVVYCENKSRPLDQQINLRTKRGKEIIQELIS